MDSQIERKLTVHENAYFEYIFHLSALLSYVELTSDRIFAHVCAYTQCVQPLQKPLCTLPECHTL